jgi:hypothetical protein
MSNPFNIVSLLQTYISEKYQFLSSEITKEDSGL